MLNPREIKDSIMELVVSSIEVPFVAGNGILTNVRIGFDKAKLEANKQRIATMLQELGVDEHPLISLNSLTRLKNGEVWNQLRSLEDFQALEFLLACSDACGFIHNDACTIQMNINELGDLNSLIISGAGRTFFDNDAQWLESIRSVVVNNMYFLTDGIRIKKVAAGSQELPEAPARLIKN